MPWLRLIRWNNLLIIFLTQLLVWWCVLLPESPVELTPLNFLLLALSTVLIAAAGYIINDYFDIKIDAINKPDKVVLENSIPRKHAIIAHAVLNIIAFLLAGRVALAAHHPQWLLVQIGSTVMLWYYSTDFKRQYVTGNIVISLLTALTVLTLLIYEPVIRGRNEAQQLYTGTILSKPGWVLLIYAYFAFMLTWMREIVKDMEDIMGDEAEGCKTMPVLKGLKYSSRFIAVLGFLVILPLAAAAFLLFLHHETWLPSYIIALLILPITAWSILLFSNTTALHYHKASNWLKVIMLLGIFSLFIYHLQLTLNHAA